ncbi:MAG: carboxypeptidase-like regulatory domain-containing protein [Stygiobacter sp.]|nr:MAG: carboxypeptidase-like regulatory domain-containing protein [Stygiobacter sp.]
MKKIAKHFVTLFSIVLLLSAASDYFAQSQQTTLKGKVVNAETNEPIQYATVFIAFTSKGCLTDENGEFIITNIAEGKYEVVCAAVGYEKITTNHSLKTGKEINVTYKLKPVPIQVNEINVTASVPEDWEDNLLKFTKEFLGESSLSEHCTIANPEVIDFEIRDDELIASSKQPLYIFNQALGYKVTIYIKEFVWNTNYDLGKIAYEPFFEDMHSDKSDEETEWKKNRKETYLGSFRHFLKSCADNKVYEQGFRLYEFKDDEWFKRPIVKSVLWQSEKSLDTLLARILSKDSDNSFKIESKNTIAVLFLNKGEDSNYKWYKKRVYRSDELKSFQSSYLKFLTGTLLFNTVGNITDKLMFNIQYTGYWAWKRVSDLLPDDYELPKDDE